MKRVIVPTGLYNISVGFQKAYETAEKTSERRYLNALKERLQEANNGIALEDMESIRSPQIVDSFNAFIKSSGLSDGYRRNLLSRLYKVLSFSPELEDLSCFQNAWEEELQNKASRESLRSPSMGYWLEYVKVKKILPRKITDEELSDFADYLSSTKGMNRGGTAYNYRRTMRDVLKKVDLFIAAPDKSIEFPKRLSGELAKISIYAQNKHLNEEERNSLFLEDHGGNSREIEAVTVKKLRYQVHSWVRFYKDEKDIEIESLEEILNKTFLKEYLDYCYKNQLITKQTAASALDNAKSLKRLAIESEAISGTQDEIISFRNDLKPLYGALKKFKKLGVNEILRNQGGLPATADLHREWIKNIKRNQLKWKARFDSFSLTKPSESFESFLKGDLQDLRGALFTGISLFVAPRSGDIVDIKIENLRKIEEYWHLFYTPNKTSHHFNAPVVDVSLPKWITPLLEDYLIVRKLIHKDSEFLFPAFSVTNKNEKALSHGQKKSFSHVQVQAMSKRWLGKSLSSNEFRKILTTTYKMYGLRDLYEATGHSAHSTSYEDRGFLTEVESSNYLISNDVLLVRKAKSRSDLLAEEFEIDPNENLGFLSPRTRSRLQKDDST